MDAGDVAEIKLNALNGCHANAKNAGKHFFIFDKTGNVGTFYNYQAHVNEFAKNCLKEAMGGTREDTLEAARKSVVGCTKSGALLVFNFGKLTKDLTGEFKSTDFPTDKIFS